MDRRSAKKVYDYMGTAVSLGKRTNFTRGPMKQLRVSQSYLGELQRGGGGLEVVERR